MKVCYVLSTTGVAEGANRSFMELVAGLKKKDPSYEFVVIINKNGPIEKELTRRNIKYYIVNYNDSTSTNRFKRNLKKALKNIYRWHEIMTIFKREDIDILHNNSLPTTIGMEAAQIMKIPYVCHIRENMKDGLGMAFIFPLYEQWIVNRAKRVICISEYVKEAYTYLGDNPRVMVLKDGLQTDHYVQFRKILTNENVNVLIVGVINPQKGQWDAVRAIELMHKEGYSNIFLTILGMKVLRKWGKSYCSDLSDYVERHELKWVNFLDPVEDLVELRKIRNKADINLVCSSAEGLGRTTIESMLSGALTIAANSGATPEVVIHGNTGLLYETGNTADLADKIKWAVSHRNESRQIAERGQSYAMQEFDLDRYCARIDMLYHDILG